LLHLRLLRKALLCDSDRDTAAALLLWGKSAAQLGSDLLQVVQALYTHGGLALSY
jgi:hypothetical protein